jgi:hypothetical protein
MEQLYSRITEQARHQYTIAYAPAGNNRTSTYHHISLQIPGQTLSVQTRKGYFNHPDY